MMRAFYLLAIFLGLFMGGCGVEWLPPPPQVEQFYFVPNSVVDVPNGSTQTSAPATIVMDTSDAKITVSGGTYSVNGGDFTSTAGTVVDGDEVRVRHTAASTAGTTVTTKLTVGGKTATFSSTTAGGADAFSFSPAAVFRVTAGSIQTSNVADINVKGTAEISVTGGEYSVDGSAFTTSTGSIGEGAHTVQVKQTAADDVSTTTAVTTVTIGGTSASFTSTTRNVAEATVDASGPADTVVPGQIALQLKPGTYTINLIEGYALYSLNGVNGDYDDASKTVAFTDGQVIYFQGFANPTVGDVFKTVFTIDNVPITFNVHTTQ